jgi:hypothetical protein
MGVVSEILAGGENQDPCVYAYVPLVVGSLPLFG